MKHHLLITLLFLFAGLSANAQGTKEDYKRAYSLESKFGEQNVRHWAHRIAWKDSTHVLTYYIDGDSGRVYYEYDAETKTRRQVAAPQEPARPPRFGRHHERHWMEVDEEKEARPVLSPDGKSEAWIEGHNVVMHAAGQP